MPILDAETLEFISRSATQTQRLGERLGALLQGGDTLALVGELGTGKTVFAQGIGKG
ncbi:MAG: tRNA (adenosine(37)-N6)-threonylcarbamoyltransferase complex ATPase subunit type 1 TsaE, partial [Anaerolineae bacterium]|nr:tRNA (adenosine(37)-N6)-threonylcarbamoyltransferase complex ATPase subunit type 1 TsaE [Anaerolineae bacterium]